MDYKICLAQPEMIPVIAQMEIEIFCDPWSEYMLSIYLPDDTHDFYVAVEPDGKVLGYILGMAAVDEGYIDNVAVRTDARHLGIGTALVEQAIQRAKERNLVLLTLEVRASNTSAISLYEKYGFREVGRRKNYYKTPREDAILMTLFFKDFEVIS